MTTPAATPQPTATSTVDAPIVAVTVYPDRARVTRRGTVRLPAGRHRMHVEPLPLLLQADSVRVGGQGPATVLGVDVVRRSHPRTPDAEVAALRARRRAVAAELAAVDDADAVARQHAEFLTSLGQRASGTFARTLATGATDAAAVTAFAGTLTTQLGEVHARRRQLAQRKETLAEDVASLDRQLSAVDNRAQPDRLAAAVDLDVADGGGEVHLELSYVVGGAGWSSAYDLRVEGERLALSWYGLVTQRTGEDWPECELLLSTARPSGAAAVPELDPWYLDRWLPPPVSTGVRYRSAGAPGGPAPPGAVPAPAAAPGDAMLEMEARSPVRESVAAVAQGATAATYRSARPVAVPADGASHRATVAVLDLDAALDYVTAPVKAAEAHLRATVVNGSEHTLLPGTAAVFTGGDFVGNTALQTWAPGEEVELALGVDDRIRVERELVGRRATKAALGSTRRREVEYRTTVTNHTPRPARVTVLDQLPVSRDENITVKELRVQPAPAERTDLGVLTWKVELVPGAAVEILLGVRVDAKGVEVTGWRE